MKTLTLLIAALFLCTAGFSQKKDTTKIVIGKKKILIIDQETGEDENTVIINDSTKIRIGGEGEEGEDSLENEKEGKKFNGYWQGIDIGINNYLNSQYRTTLPPDNKFLELDQGKSWYVGLNIFEQTISIIKNNVGLVTGMGLGINNYRFNNNVTLIYDSSYIGAFCDTLHAFTKNKLTATWLQAPLLLEFQVQTGEKKRDNIHLAVGVTGGLRLGSHSKQMYEINGMKYNNKNHDDYHLPTWRYGLSARIGYRSINLFVNYDLSTLFKTDEGPDLYPVSAGISLAGF
jgi:hypothetical protein